MTFMGSNALWRAIKKNGDEAMSRFFEGLQRRKLIITRCPPCDTLHFPPRFFCPDCHNKDVKLEEHAGRGQVYSFTTMVQPFFGGAPSTVGMVELKGVEGRIFSRVEAPYEKMTIGMEVEVDYFEMEEIVLHCFRPVAKGSR